MIKNAFSKTQIDRLGDRLKGGPHTETDLRLLDDYRRSFGDAYKDVVRISRERGQHPTGRSAKSIRSIVDKLRRESIRLSQVQDIAGCRIVVTDVMEQERVVASLGAAFPGASVIDRCENPSYGYRAVHIVAEISGKPVEIQVRTSLQHMWANLSEKSSDVIDPTIKYGGGPDRWRNSLTLTSKSVAACEVVEKKHSEAVTAHEKFEKAVAKPPEHHEPNYVRHEDVQLRGKLEGSRLRMETLSEELVALRNKNADLLTKMISSLDINEWSRSNDFSNRIQPE